MSATLIALGALAAWMTAPLHASAAADGPAGIEPRAGLVISDSARIAPGEYRLDSPDLESPVLTVRGNGIVVDFTDVVLVGAHDPQRPDEFTGLALRVEGSDITITGLAARGYKVAILAHDVPRLTIRDCNLSYNWRANMRSSPWAEDLADWMSFHNNQDDQWLRFGAAIYLRGCEEFDIHDNVVTGGQCGIMLTDSNHGRIWNNLISFNSAIGIGMFRSSHNRIMHNRLDFNVRGHSEGVYNRGQDSAAILVYEQSSNNVFAFNSATHSGDGFFLWAGQTTMDTGEGGSNDNLLYMNDFSFAPTNGIEATFSRNTFVGNRLHGCWHGIWGGYSYDTLIIANDFADNTDGIAIEHGQDNTIAFNTFSGDRRAIRLWAREQEPPDWPFAQLRDTASRDYSIYLNTFESVEVAIHARRTRAILELRNTYREVGERFDVEEAEIMPARNRFGADATAEAMLRRYRPDEIEGARLPGRLAEHPPRRDAIRVTEWGPYDYRRPIIWPAVAEDRRGLTLDILGPAGEWEVIEVEGAEVAERQEASGEPLHRGRLVLATADGPANDEGDDPLAADREVRVEIRFTAEDEVTDEFGRRIEADTPLRVIYRQWIGSAIRDPDRPFIRVEHRLEVEE